MFTKKSYPLIQIDPVDEPSVQALTVHCFGRQISTDKTVMYPSDRVDKAAYPGIYAANYTYPVLDRPKGCDHRSLAQLDTRQNLAVFVPDIPAVITDIDQPVSFFPSLFDRYFTCNPGIGIVEADEDPESVSFIIT